MQVKLNYDTDFITLQIPDNNIADIITPAGHNNSDHTSRPTNDQLIRQTLDHPEFQLFTSAVKNKTLAVLLADGTRDMPIPDILAHMLPALKQTKQTLFLITTGTHNADTPENQKIFAGIKNLLRSEPDINAAFHAHDCSADNLINAGQTSRGTKIQYNAIIQPADIFLVLSDIKCHYFAGYSNPIKNFVPGLCSYDSTEHNHSMALDPRSSFGRHPWHHNPDRRDNPLADDQLEAMRKITASRPVFAFVTISSARQIHWARFADAQSASADAFDQVDNLNCRAVSPRKYLIVSPGGAPNDVDLYISQRALELTRDAVRQGGQILFVSACPKGIGEPKTLPNFYDRLTAPLDHVKNIIEQEYTLFSHKAYKFATLIEKLSSLYVHSQIPDAQLHAIHLQPAHDPQQIVDQWIAADPNEKILIINGANKIALYPCV